MAKKKEKYAKFPNVTGDLNTKSGKYELDKELTQKQLETLYNEEFTEIVYKIEG